MEKSLQVRIGFPFVETFGLEDLFYKYGVDREQYFVKTFENLI